MLEFVVSENWQSLNEKNRFCVEVIQTGST